MTDYSLSELCIAAAADAWRDDGEVLATGITLLPRLAAGLAKLTINPALMLTNGENMFAAAPVPVGPRKADDFIAEGWAPYDRTFYNLWSGKRHAMVSPVQIDRFGQTNINLIGDVNAPKRAFLGARGFPGNSISHPNSLFVYAHSTKTFVADEVDYVCSVGYNPARWPDGKKPAGLDLRVIITDLCLLDFNGPNNAIRLKSVHPGISVDQIVENTGFSLVIDGEPPTTPAPTEEQLTIIREKLDPHDMRATAFKGNPPGDRR